MSNWTIRVATLDDVEGLQSCMHSAYSPYTKRMGEQSLPPLEIDYTAEIKNFPTWVAEAEGRIVGGLTMSFNDGRATLSNIAVDTDFQGCGLGRVLMNFAEKETRAHGFRKLHLATHKLLTENIAIYEHLGWKETGQAGSKVFFEKKLPANNLAPAHNEKIISRK